MQIQENFLLEFFSNERENFFFLLYLCLSISFLFLYATLCCSVTFLFSNYIHCIICTLLLLLLIPSLLSILFFVRVFFSFDLKWGRWTPYMFCFIDVTHTHKVFAWKMICKQENHNTFYWSRMNFYLYMFTHTLQTKLNTINTHTQQQKSINIYI